MRPKASKGLASALTAAVLMASLVLATAAQARSGDWADRQKAKQVRWEQSQTDDGPKPKDDDQ